MARYDYDEENLLVMVKRASDDATLLAIAYDAVGRRVQTIDYVGPGHPCAGSTGILPVWTRHVYAGLETLEEHLCCGTGVPACEPEEFVLAREFVWGTSFPEPVAMVDWTDAGAVASGTAEPLHYLHQHLGSVAVLTNADGEPVERYTYDPYGKTVIEQIDPATGQPTARLSASAFGNPFAWTGQRYDPGVKLYHFLFRSYSPELGRWMQRDPAGYVDGTSLYWYGRGSPLRFFDPFGLDVKVHINKAGSSGPSSSDLGHVWIVVSSDDGTNPAVLNVYPGDGGKLTYDTNDRAHWREGEIILVIETTEEEEERGRKAIQKRKEEIDKDKEYYNVIWNNCVVNTINVCEIIFNIDLDAPWWPESVDDELKNKLPDRKCSEQKGKNEGEGSSGGSSGSSSGGSSGSSSGGSSGSSSGGFSGDSSGRGSSQRSRVIAK